MSFHQVQVLREEFRSQQPQLTHLEEVAHTVLKRLTENDQDANKLRQKLQVVQDKWNDLLTQLVLRVFLGFMGFVAILSCNMM